MSYRKKISDKEFVRDVIDFELKKYGIDYDYVNNLPKKPTDGTEIDPSVEYQDSWYSRYTFDSIDEFRAFRKYFYEHCKDWLPKHMWKKDLIYREFEWFNLQFGLATKYEYEFKDYQKIADEIWKEVFGKKK